MCLRHVHPAYPEEGQCSERGEDASVQRELYQRCAVAGLSGCGYLYAYVYHGRNTWDKSHHLAIVGAMSMPGSFVKAHLTALARHVREYFPELPRGIGTKEGELLDFVADSSL
jgi:hypothetical protein